MKITAIAFTAYPVTDLKRARRFYEGALGLQMSSCFGDDNAAWVEYEIGPATLAISNFVPEWKAAPTGGCAGLEVDDFDAALSRLKEEGVPILNGPMESPVCRMVIVSDPDGNAITLHKAKAPAATSA